MADDLHASVRNPDAYALGRRAIDMMEHARVWPTPLNYELWLHFITHPESALAKELERLIAAGDPITEHMSEELASNYLPRLRLNDEIRDAGDQLSQQLDNIGKAIDTAQRSSEAYGRTLAGAERELAGEQDAAALQALVAHLSQATQRIHRENGSLEKRLAESTQEVRRLREHLEQVRRDAMTDALTLLANRKAFDESLERACADTDESGAPLTLAVIDIDHFKRFNDTWGHQTGDQVIRYVASIIGRVGALPRVASRYGGEEFAILFPSEPGSKAHQALEAIRLEICSRQLKRRSTNEDLGAVTVSAGFAQRLPGESASALIERADAALYTSKRTGRNLTTDAEAPNKVAA